MWKFCQLQLQTFCATGSVKKLLLNGNCMSCMQLHHLCGKYAGYDSKIMKNMFSVLFGSTGLGQ